MLEKCDALNRQGKRMVVPSKKVTAKLEFVFVLTLENAFP